ncbi:MAG: hypothetical protein KAY09_01820 [Nitrospira sp.]|nr:hypothetical protein [Nitrospira sp.]
MEKLYWFIDAWAVLDGYAFASFRRPDSLDADVALFVAPPYFEPEPVASLATALGATRGHFQEGFRTETGEVAFGTLEEVIETIRRAYRAGGLDIDGTPLQAVRPPPIEPPSSSAALKPADLVTPEMRNAWWSLHETLLDTSTGPAREKEIQSLLSHLLQASLPTLVPKFIGYATLTLLSMMIEAGPERSTRVREACAWIDRARGLGVRVDVDTEHDRVVVFLMGTSDGFEWAAPWLRQLPQELHSYLHPIAYRTSGALVSDFQIPFTVPIVPAFQARGVKIDYPEVPTLGHLMAVATADRLYMLTLDAMHQLVPLLVLGLIQLPPAALPYPGLPLLPETAESRETCDRAAAWLARALPSGILRDHTAEDAIHQLVIRLLTRSNDDDEGTPAQRSSPHIGPQGPGAVSDSKVRVRLMGQ